MIVKFHPRGSGRGSGPIDYLLGRDRQREGATLDRGDPAVIMALIDSSPYAKKYTSGVLSFAEADLSRETKDKLMSDFEKMLLPGLDADQYSCLWVEHRDKGRLELNFVIPNIELTSGTRLQPYYDKCDKPRVNAWKIGVNAEHQLHDPDDPIHRRELVTPRNLPLETQKAAQALTDGLLHMAAAGSITNRSSVVNALSGAGFEVGRQTKNSISIANPDGGRNIRLKGMIYEQNFRFGEGLRGEIEAASIRYRDQAETRIREARAICARGIELKRQQNQKRHNRPERDYEPLSAQIMGLDSGDSNNRFSHDSGCPVVSGQPDSREPRSDKRTRTNLEIVTESNVRDSTTPEPTGRAFHPATERLESRSELDGRQAKRDKIGEKINDGIRVTVTRICKSVSAAARAATNGIVEQLQGFAAHVHHYVSRESGTQNAGKELSRAGQRLGIATEQINDIANQIAMQRGRRNDRGLNR